MQHFYCFHCTVRLSMLFKFVIFDFRVVLFAPHGNLHIMAICVVFTVYLQCIYSVFTVYLQCIYSVTVLVILSVQ